MPRGDRTGPMGMGRMSGRGAGYCAGYQVPGCANQAGFGRGMGFGRGRGGGGFRRMFAGVGMPRWGRFSNAPYADESTVAANEKAFLKDRAAFLEEELAEVKTRLSNMEKDNE